VYDAIPTVVTTFVAIVAKISIFIFLLELVHYTSKSMFDLDFSWTMSLLFSSLLSLVIGSIVGLTQSRIKRLFAFSTISHVGFILLGLSIHSIESTQAFMFYLMQYSISNLNAFILIITIGYTLFLYIYKYYGNDYVPKVDDFNFDYYSEDCHTIDEDEIVEYEKKDDQILAEKHESMKDINISPIQLIDQLRGYYYVNPILSLSLAITLFSFAGIPPLIGFFAKQMILSAAIDSGYIFMSLIAILTSVISAVYYLAIIKEMFFDTPYYIISPPLQNFYADCLITEETDISAELGVTNEELQQFSERAYIGILEHYMSTEEDKIIEQVNINAKSITISSSLSLPISIITSIITLFMFNPQE
jgi:NADH-ubiquinone oxidoreductase chain 2